MIRAASLFAPLLPSLALASAFPIDDGAAQSPAVATDGEVFLVVWAEASTETGGDVLGARVRVSDGSVLDPGGFPIAQEPGNQLTPRVASDGKRFLVTWSDDASGAGDIAAALVDDGAVTATLRVSGASGAQLNPFVVALDGGWLVAWEDWRAPGDYAELFAGRLSADGAPLDGDGFALTHGDGPDAERLGGLASNGSLAAAVHRNGAARVTFVGADGTVAGTQALGSGGHAGESAIASDGAGFLAVHGEASELDGTPALRASVFGADGTPSGSSVLRAVHGEAAVAWTGREYAVVQADRNANGLVAVRVHADGSPIDEEGVLLATDLEWPAAAGGLAVAQRGDAVLGAVLDFSGRGGVLDPFAAIGRRTPTR